MQVRFAHHGGGKRWHPVFSRPYLIGNLSIPHPESQSAQRRGHTKSKPVRSVALLAGGFIDNPARCFGGGQIVGGIIIPEYGNHPAKIVGADIKPSCVRVNAHARPFRSAIHSKIQIRMSKAGRSEKAGVDTFEACGHKGCCFLCAVSEIGGGEFHLGKRLRQFGIGLVGGGLFARQITRGRPAHAKREDGFARHPVQQQRVAVLGRGRDHIHPLAISRDGGQVRRCRHVAIPKVVGNLLEMPQPLACSRVQSDQAVGKKIIAVMSHTDEIRLRSAGGDVRDAAHFVHHHARPIVGCVILGSIPGVVAKFAGMRHRVKCPQLFARPRVKSPDILFKSRHHDDLLEHGGSRSGGSKFALRPPRHSHPAVLTEILDQAAVFRIQRIQILPRAKEDPFA